MSPEQKPNIVAQISAVMTPNFLYRFYKASRTAVKSIIGRKKQVVLKPVIVKRNRKQELDPQFFQRLLSYITIYN